MDVHVDVNKQETWAVDATGLLSTSLTPLLTFVSLQALATTIALSTD